MAATAFLLAAGLGTRLRPLTLSTPKPLLPVRGRPMLDHVLDHVRAHGHDEVVVNAWWLADRILDWARGKAGVTVVVETPAVLGTGGGLRNARQLLADRFVVVNGDILADVDLTALLHEPAPAVMALRPQPTPAITPVALDVSGVVRGIGGVVGGLPGSPPLARDADTGLHFTGVHALDRAVLEHVPAGEQCIVRTAYRALIPEGRVRGIVHQGAWTDIGTLQEYEAVRG
jgi:NDP-sugar pyrophosphorylase family protein